MPNYDESIIYEYHPSRPEDVAAYVRIRDKSKELALLLRELCPPSRELSIARTHLEQVGMLANAAIARHPAYLHKAEKAAKMAEALSRAGAHCEHCQGSHPNEKCPRLVLEEKEQLEREAAVAEAARVAEMRAKYPNAKNQTVGTR